MKAILFIGHGSRLAAGNDEVRTFIQQLTPSIDDNFIVETCFLEFEAPNIPAGIDACIQRGATEVYAVPIILLQAGHSKIHIPAAIDAARIKYPNVSFTYGRPLGVHEEVLNILTERLSGTGLNVAEKHEDTAVLFIGRGGSDADANSDFYKIGRLLWEQLDVLTVECAFMGVTNPSVEQGIERCYRLGAKKIIMLPYFLFTGILMERMEGMQKSFAAMYADVDIRLADYFGYHPKLKTVLLDRMEEAIAGDVKMNCDTCQYRINASAFVEHHHDHDHDHGHHHHHHHDHDHDHHHDHAHEHHHDEELVK